MGNDMVVALPRATADGATLFGHNCNRPAAEPQALERVPGRHFAAGESIRTAHLNLPQARHTATVLAVRSGSRWGYAHGVNEHGVAAGTTTVRTRMPHDRPGLSGPDFVRLALERASSALQAVDVVTDLVGRHGPGAATSEDDAGDPMLFLADGREAYLLAACGRYWAVQEVREVRAQSDVCHLRQDWDRISPGLADFAIGRGWWPDDGSKLDFAGALISSEETSGSGLRRWGRATVVLEQQNGQIDAGLVRRLLVELSDAARTGADGTPTAASLVARVVPDGRQPPLFWWCCGLPGAGVYLPLSLDGDLPEGLANDGTGCCEVWQQTQRLDALSRRDRQVGAAARSAFAGLQARLDRDGLDFLTEASELRFRCDGAGLHRLATAFMQHTLERLEETYDALDSTAESKPGFAPLKGPHLHSAVPS